MVVDKVSQSLISGRVLPAVRGFSEPSEHAFGESFPVQAARAGAAVEQARWSGRTAHTGEGERL